MSPSQAFVFHTVSRSRPRRFVQCATVGSFAAHWQETLYNMFTFACLFLLPLLVMVLCYGRILAAISGRMKEAGGERGGWGRAPPPPFSSLFSFFSVFPSALPLPFSSSLASPVFPFPCTSATPNPPSPLRSPALPNASLHLPTPAPSPQLINR